MAFWWVNQNQTWKDEISGEYLWSPKLNANGHHNQSYDNMTRLSLGDIVFSHYEGAIRSVGVVVESAISSPKPDFGFKGTYWSNDGWNVGMKFVELPEPIVPQDHLDLYNQLAPERHAPMNPHGRVNQQYLFELPTILGDTFLGFAGLNVELVKDSVRFDDSIEGLLREAEEVLADPGLTPTEKRVLARARVGQGIFRDRVRRFESSCRLTGLSTPGYLVASHMKPWRNSSNAERLDGHNGLLLSPHVDHLFDRGLITFSNSGQVVASTQLPSTVPKAWKLNLKLDGKPFRKGQLPFLEYHRDVVFQGRKLIRID